MDVAKAGLLMLIAHSLSGCGYLVVASDDATLSGVGATKQLNEGQRIDAELNGDAVQHQPYPMPPAAVLVESDEEITVAELAVHHAMTMIGRQYRRRAASPQRGFDASGLVHYSFAKAGGAIPRQHDGQRRASGRIFVSNLRLGDLVYFDADGKKHSHVGIYIGDGRFVHASPTLRRVRMERIDTPYWQQLLSEARRLDTRRGLLTAQ